jgi:hypothetical protein
MSSAAITLCVASQRVFTVASVYFVIDSVRNLLDTPSYITQGNILSLNKRKIIQKKSQNSMKCPLRNLIHLLLLVRFCYKWTPPNFQLPDPRAWTMETVQHTYSEIN